MLGSVVRVVRSGLSPPPFRPDLWINRVGAPRTGLRPFALPRPDWLSPRCGLNVVAAYTARASPKENSRKFKVANGSSTARQALENRLCGTPLGSKRGNLVAVVAPLRIKGLRLVTARPPEKFLVPSGLYQPPCRRADRPKASALSCERTTRTGQGAWRITPSEILPSMALLIPRWPRQPITISPTPSSLAKATTSRSTAPILG